jgi:hypothetical protein
VLTLVGKRDFELEDLPSPEGKHAMSNILSATAKAQIADELADVLEVEARAEGASPRLGAYAAMFRALSDRILAQLGRTGAWREARGAISGKIAWWDELTDYWLDKLYHDLDADAGLVVTDPTRAKRAGELLDALYPVYTLAALRLAAATRKARAEAAAASTSTTTSGSGPLVAERRSN